MIPGQLSELSSVQNVLQTSLVFNRDRCASHLERWRTRDRSQLLLRLLFFWLVHIQYYLVQVIFVGGYIIVLGVKFLQHCVSVLLGKRAEPVHPLLAMPFLV